MIGRNGKIGPVPGTPRMSLSQPHWKIATVMPRAAENESSDVTAAVSGTTIDRKSSTRAKNPSPMTIVRKIGSASPRTVVKSLVIACEPPTYNCAPVAASRAGLTSSRRRSSSCVVASSCGELAGYTAMA